MPTDMANSVGTSVSLIAEKKTSQTLKQGKKQISQKHSKDMYNMHKKATNDSHKLCTEHWCKCDVVEVEMTSR